GKQLRHQNSRALCSLAANHCLPATALLQDSARSRVHQHGEPITRVVAIHLHQGGTFAFNAPAEYTSQAQQRAAAADLASLASAVADDLAVRAQHCFQQRNGTQLLTALVCVTHGNISAFTLAGRPRAGKCLLIEEAEE